MISLSFLLCLLMAGLQSHNGKSTQPDPSIEKFEETINRHGNKHEVKNCTTQELTADDVVIFLNGTIFLKTHNLTFPAHLAILIDDHSNMCFNRSRELVKEILQVCDTWIYEEDDFTVLWDGRVHMFGDTLEPGTFDLREDGKLEMCSEDYDYVEGNDTTDEVTPTDQPHHFTTVVIYLGNIGSAISIVALTAHLIMFFLAKTLRNLPGYSLASLSVAFLLAYSSLLISQIPEVLGTSCVVFAVLQQNFFLVAFCCMNTMAFDVWRTLKMATTQLIVSSSNTKRKQFIIYSLYSWGIPLIISTLSVVLDNADGVPEWLRPEFGVHDSCWMNNDYAKTVLFSIPAFTLFFINAVFFVMSAFIIKRNTMKSTNDEPKQTARLHFVLFVRLGLMMGVTWIFGIIGALSFSPIFWTIFEVLNSLQGLFVFLLFSCSKKVFRSVQENIRMNSLRSTKTSTTFENKSSSTH